LKFCFKYFSIYWSIRKLTTHIKNALNPTLKFIQDRIGKVITDSPSKITNWLQMTPQIAEKDKIVVEITVRPDMTNMIETLPGGISAAILDDLCTTVCLISDDFFYASVNLTIDYLQPAVVGVMLIGTAEVVREGKNIINVHSTLAFPDGRLVARASSNVYNTNVQRRR
jgi:acyl-coenzyme A thioesterase 13